MKEIETMSAWELMQEYNRLDDIQARVVDRENQIQLWLKEKYTDEAVEDCGLPYPTKEVVEILTSMMGDIEDRLKTLR